EPTPTPASSAGSISAGLAASRSAISISLATAAGPPLVGVCRREEPSTLWSSSTITAWILVPPRSIPPDLAIGGIIADGQSGAGPSIGPWRSEEFRQR